MTGKTPEQDFDPQEVFDEILADEGVILDLEIRPAETACFTWGTVTIPPQDVAKGKDFFFCQARHEVGHRVVPYAPSTVERALVSARIAELCGIPKPAVGDFLNVIYDLMVDCTNTERFREYREYMRHYTYNIYLKSPDPRMRLLGNVGKLILGEKLGKSQEEKLAKKVYDLLFMDGRHFYVKLRELARLLKPLFTLENRRQYGSFGERAYQSENDRDQQQPQPRNEENPQEQQEQQERSDQNEEQEEQSSQSQGGNQDQEGGEDEQRHEGRGDEEKQERGRGKDEEGDREEGINSERGAEEKGDAESTEDTGSAEDTESEGEEGRSRQEQGGEKREEGQEEDMGEEGEQKDGAGDNAHPEDAGEDKEEGNRGGEEIEQGEQENQVKKGNRDSEEGADEEGRTREAKEGSKGEGKQERDEEQETKQEPTLADMRAIEIPEEVDESAGIDLHSLAREMMDAGLVPEDMDAKDYKTHRKLLLTYRRLRLLDHYVEVVERLGSRRSESEELETWRIGDEPKKLEALESVQRHALLLPGVTTLKRASGSLTGTGGSGSIMLMVDVSGSTMGEVIETERQAAFCIAETARRNGDEIGIVTFSTGVVESIAPTRTEYEEVIEVILEMRALAYTNISDAASTAYEYIKDKPYSVTTFLITDGWIHDLEPAMPARRKLNEKGRLVIFLITALQDGKLPQIPQKLVDEGFTTYMIERGKEFSEEALVELRK